MPDVLERELLPLTHPEGGLQCQLCGARDRSLAQYATGWGGAFSGGLFGPHICSQCAPPGTYTISAIGGWPRYEPKGPVRKNPIHCSKGCGRIVGYALMGRWEGEAVCPACEGRPEPSYPPPRRSLWERIMGS